MEKSKLKNLVVLGLLLLLIASLAYLYISLSRVAETPQSSSTSQDSTREYKKPDVNKESSEKADAEKLVKDSFTDYFNEVNSGDQQNALKNFKKHVTDQVAAELEGQEVLDPVLCTFTTPSKISFSEPSISKDMNNMIVTSYFEEGTVHTAVSVDTKLGKIVSLQCLTTAG